MTNCRDLGTHFVVGSQQVEAALHGLIGDPSKKVRAQPLDVIGKQVAADASLLPKVFDLIVESLSDEGV
jgi:hypothetical protein